MHQIKARKLHRCDYCGCLIQAGDLYSWQKLLTDGFFYLWKCHLYCDSFANKECESSLYEGISVDSFVYEVGEWQGREEELEAKYPGMGAVLQFLYKKG